MKVFFNASLTGKKEFNENYQAIIKEIEQKKYELISPIKFERTILDRQKESTAEATKYYRKLVSWINESNICVFEVSYPSTGIGHEISMAMKINKPVIALHVKSSLPYVLEAIPSEELQVVEYSLDNLHKLLPTALKYAEEKQDTRFNFFISPQIGIYLDWVAKKKRVPRAVYLRRLIDEDMKKNAEVEN